MVVSHTFTWQVFAARHQAISVEFGRRDMANMAIEFRDECAGRQVPQVSLPSRGPL